MDQCTAGMVSMGKVRGSFPNDQRKLEA